MFLIAKKSLYIETVESPVLHSDITTSVNVHRTNSLFAEFRVVTSDRAL